MQTSLLRLSQSNRPWLRLSDWLQVCGDLPCSTSSGGRALRRCISTAGATMLSCKHVIIGPRPTLRPYVRERAGPGGYRLRLVQPFVRRAAGVENSGAERRAGRPSSRQVQDSIGAQAASKAALGPGPEPRAGPQAASMARTSLLTPPSTMVALAPMPDRTASGTRDRRNRGPRHRTGRIAR